jgi:molecular chaperone DnaK (HSP70)
MRHLMVVRGHFEELNIDLFIKCMEIVEKCIRDAKMDKSTLMGRSSAGELTPMRLFLMDL